jgi:hypothetical protein
VRKYKQMGDGLLHWKREPGEIPHDQQHCHSVKSPNITQEKKRKEQKSKEQKRLSWPPRGGRLMSLNTARKSLADPSLAQGGKLEVSRLLLLLLVSTTYLLFVPIRCLARSCHRSSWVNLVSCNHSWCLLACFCELQVQDRSFKVG